MTVRWNHGLTNLSGHNFTLIHYQGESKVETLFDDLVIGLTQAINYEKGLGEGKVYKYSENDQDIANKIISKEGDSECHE